MQIFYISQIKDKTIFLVHQTVIEYILKLFNIGVFG